VLERARCLDQEEGVERWRASKMSRSRRNLDLGVDSMAQDVDV